MYKISKNKKVYGARPNGTGRGAVKARFTTCVKIIAAFTAGLILILANSVLSNIGAGIAFGAQSGYRTVKACVFNFEGYHDMDTESGILSGYGIEFLNLVSKYSHINFEYTDYDVDWNWDTDADKDGKPDEGTILYKLNNRDFDVVTSVSRNDKREEQCDFSLPIGRKKTVLSIRADETRFVRGNYGTYRGKGENGKMLVGQLTGNSQNNILFEFADGRFEYDIEEYESAQDLAAALQNGDIDAIISSNLRKTTNEKELDILEESDFYAVVRKGDTELLDEINRAIRQMDIDEGDWQNTLFYKYYGPTYSSDLMFSVSEQAYIDRIKETGEKITVTALVDRVPYAYMEDGELKGIMPDYFAELMKLAGLDGKFKFVAPGTSGVDVLLDESGADDITEDDVKACFKTDSYMTARMARVTRQDHKGGINTVALADVRFKDIIEQDGYTVVMKSTDEEAMKAVQSNEVDAAYVYSYTAQWYINHGHADSLYYTSMNGLSTSFSMHISEDTDHELITILDKCIRQISDEELNQIALKYTSYIVGDLTFWQYLQANPGIIVAVCVVTALIIFAIVVLLLRMRWNNKLLHTTEQSKSKMAEQLAIVEALSRDYVNVFNINPDNAASRIVKLEGYVTDGLKKDSAEEYNYSEILGNYIKTRVHPDDRQKLTDALSLDNVKDKLNEAEEYQGSYRISANGEVHNFQYTYLKLADNEHGNGNSILAGFRNIDDILLKEQEQKEFLKEALTQAQYANKAKTTFLNSMSHDIRTPMNAIIGFTNLALKHTEDVDQTRDYLGKIITSGNHLLSLINDVLDMSRIESGKVKIEEKEVSLSEIIRDLKTIVESDVKTKQLEFRVDVQDVKNDTIVCDKLRLNQVLLNILSNAIKYTNPGGSVSVLVAQTAEAQDGYASYKFSVKDTGIGMSSEFLKHVFEPFEREKTSTVSGIQGTGLGLAITKSIVDMMGGTITVESEQGKGSEFIVTFCFKVVESTVEEQRSETASADAGNSEMSFEGKRILLVEDNELNQEIAQSILEEVGFIIDTADDGSVAVEQMKKMPANTYDLILMDVQMPIMNGYQATRAIRALEDPVKAAIPIVAMTANAFDEDRKEAMESGMNGYAAKPIDVEKLMKTLQDILK